MSIDKYSSSGTSSARDWAPTVLRVTLGIVFIAHAWQKITVFGLDGLGGFLASVGIPLSSAAAILLITTEMLGGIALILGVFTRLVSGILGFVMLVALVTEHLPSGFFLSVPLGSNGFEYVLTLMAASTALVLSGPGAASLQTAIAGRADVGGRGGE
ncbi:MAG: DoxX family protein [Gemmatimonadota bacterium]